MATRTFQARSASITLVRLGARIMSLRSIAELAGTVPETLARTLNEMEANSWVGRKLRQIYILHETKLRACAEIKGLHLQN
jgi:hypothetical protein